MKIVMRATLAMVATVLLTGCGDVSVTGPTLPSALPQGPQQGSPSTSVRMLEIVGSLNTDLGSCVEATILYDGQELVGARSVCQEDSGCTQLELTALARSSSGRHTISFQVLRQSPVAVDYFVGGTIRVSRVDLALGTSVTLFLEPTRATLRSGESVTFDVDFRD